MYNFYASSFFQKVLFQIMCSKCTHKTFKKCISLQCAPAQQAILHDNTSQVLRNTNLLNFISPFYSISYYPQTIVGDKKGEKIEKKQA